MEQILPGPEVTKKVKAPAAAVNSKQGFPPVLPCLRRLMLSEELGWG